MKKAEDYGQLDEAICRWIATSSIGHPANSSDLNQIAATFTAGGEPWRLIDRRMQAMRRSGRIEYIGRRKDRHGWITVFSLSSN
jgi:hypothetical protein